MLSDVKDGAYGVAMTQPDWSARLVKVIAGEVRRRRVACGMSAQQLADACDKIGYPIPRSVLANLESGRRETISVPELLVLAHALDVAPILLLFPLGIEDVAEVRPGTWASTWDAAEWFAGRRETPPALPTGDTDDGVAARPVYRDPVKFYEQLDRAISAHRRAMANAQRWRERSKTENGDVAEALELAEEQAGAAMAQLSALRNQITGAGIKLPMRVFTAEDEQ